MKKPCYPNKPIKPTKPDTHFRNSKYLIGYIYQSDSKSIEQIIEEAKLSLKNDEYLKNEVFDISKLSIRWEPGYYESDYGSIQIEYSYDIPKKQTFYNSELQHYNNKLQKYNSKLEKFNKELEQYNKDKIKYDQFIEQKKQEDKKQLYEKLKKEFENE